MLTPEEARVERILATARGDSTAWARARAVEEAAGSSVADFGGTPSRVGSVIHWDPKLHPRDRSGHFSETVGSLKVGSSVNMSSSGVQVKRVKPGIYQVSGGIPHDGRQGRTRTVVGKEAAVRDASERHNQVEDAKRAKALKPGEEMTIRETEPDGVKTIKVKKREDGTFEADRALHDDRTHHESAEQAVLKARREGWATGGVASADRPSAIKRQKDFKKRAAGADSVKQAEQFREGTEKANPDNAVADIYPDAAIELLHKAGQKIPSAFGEGAEKAGEKGAEGLHHADPNLMGQHLGRADPGVVDVAHSGAHGVLGHAASAVASHTPHGVVDVAQHIVVNHGHHAHHAAQIAHHLTQLFTSRWDQARADRIAAHERGDTTAWSRARAIEEASHTALEGLHDYVESQHPRGRYGRWVGKTLDSKYGQVIVESTSESHLHVRTSTGEPKTLSAMNLKHNGKSIAPKPKTVPDMNTAIFDILRSGGLAEGYSEALHPRGRGGEWIAKLGGLKKGESLDVEGTKVTRGDYGYTVHHGTGFTLPTPETVVNRFNSTPDLPTLSPPAPRPAVGIPEDMHRPDVVPPRPKVGIPEDMHPPTVLPPRPAVGLPEDMHRPVTGGSISSRADLDGLKPGQSAMANGEKVTRNPSFQSGQFGTGEDAGASFRYKGLTYSGTYELWKAIQSASGGSGAKAPLGR